MAQLLTVGKQRGDVGKQQVGAERLCHVYVGTGLQSFDALLLAAACCKQQHGNVACCLVLFKTGAEGESVHYGHHHVRHYDVGHALHRELQSALSVGSFYNIIAVEQQRAQISTHIGVVVHDEHRGEFLGIVVDECVVTTLLHSLATCEELLVGSYGSVVNGGAVLATEQQHVAHKALQLFYVALHDAHELLPVALALCKLFDRSGYKRERRAQLVRCVGEESSLLIIQFAHAAVGTTCGTHGTPCSEYGYSQQQYDEQRHYEQRTLYVVEAKIGLKLCLYGGEIGVLLLQRVVAQRYVCHILRRDDNAFQVVRTLERLTLKYAQSESNHFLAMCRIDVRRGELSVLHSVKALARQSVDAKKAYLTLFVQLFCSLVSSHSSKVAMTEHYIYRLAILQPFTHNALAVVIRPLTWHMTIVD